MASTVEEIAYQLERQLAEATAKIDEFIAQQSQQLQKAVHDHEKSIGELEAKIARLSTDEAAALHRAGNAHEVIAAENAALAERQAEVTRLEGEARRIPVELDAARAAETAAKAQLQAQKAEYEGRERDARYQLSELSKGVAFYRRLGLEFEKIHDDRLRLSFTQVDPADPARRFAFSLNVTPSDAYEVEDCVPPLAGGRLERLVAELNAGNDFSRFVQLARRAFKESVGAA